MSVQPHILVIDDEPQILRALRTILLARHYRVSIASRGEEGLALAAAQLPDLVILDLALPDMDGIQVCKNLPRMDAGADNRAICARRRAG